LRLLCPKCEAEYKVSDDIIPSEGRDVQCSSCNETWFVKSSPAQLERRAIDPDIISILQQEVQHEMKARENEISSQKAASTSSSTRKPAPAAKPKTQKRTPKRKRLLPVEVIEKKQIKSETPLTTPSEPEDDVPPLDNRQRGILAALILLSILASLYVFAPKLTETFPIYTDWINSYVFWMDDMRQWLENIVHDVLEYRQSFG